MVSLRAAGNGHPAPLAVSKGFRELHPVRALSVLLLNLTRWRIQGKPLLRPKHVLLDFAHHPSVCRPPQCLQDAGASPSCVRKTCGFSRLSVPPPSHCASGSNHISYSTQDCPP